MLKIAALGHRSIISQRPDKSFKITSIVHFALSDDDMATSLLQDNNTAMTHVEIEMSIADVDCGYRFIDFDVG